MKFYNLKSILLAITTQKLVLIRVIIVVTYAVFLTYGINSLINYKYKIYDTATKNAQAKALLMQQELISTIIRMDIVLNQSVKEYTKLMTGAQKIDTEKVNKDLAQMMTHLPEAQKNSLKLLDSKGEVVYSASNSAHFEKFNLSDRDYFEILKNNPNADLIISKPVKSKIRPNYVMPLNKRISYPDGSFAGFAMISINTDYISKLFSTLNIEQNGMIAVYDTNFNVVSRYPNPEKYVGKNFALTGAQELIDKNQTSGFYDRVAHADGIFRNYFFSKVPNYPFIILAGVSPKDYLNEWRDEVYYFTAISILAAFLLFILERLLTKQEKDKLRLIRQSRFVAAGEMIGNIAHQWRQPLNNLSGLIQDLSLSYELGEFDEKYLNEFESKSVNVINHMSQTIDDFRNFFKPDKEKKVFDVKDSIKSTITLVKDTLKYSFIELKIDLMNDDLKVIGFPNEFVQVLINILNNAKDALKNNRKENNRFIFIKAYKENGHIKITIYDNAGGIPKEIIEKIFDPYFTTKHASQGTGVGLYMSKLIIEQSFGGKLTVNNETNGAMFIIELEVYTATTI